MTNGKGSLTHKRWFCALLIVAMLAAALPAFAQSYGVIRNPNGGSYVNVREWGSYEAPILSTLAVGTKVEVARVDGAWYCIWANGAAGYVHSAFISTNLADTGSANREATVTVGPLNLREAPSTRARVVTQLYSGAVVTVLSYGDTWSQVRIGDLCGYVLSGYLSFSAPQKPTAPQVNTPNANATIRTQNGGNLNLRAWAGSDSESLASYANGTRVRVLTHGASWCRVQVGDKYGYMSTKYLSLDGISSGTGNVSGGYNATVTSTSILNLRQEPSTNSKVLGQYAYGTEIKVLSVGTEWHRVSVNGVTGYMMAKYVKLSSANATPHKTVQNNGTFVNLRAGAGYGFEVLKRVSSGAAATVVIPYPTWSKVIVKDGTGFMSGYMLNIFLK